MNPKLSILIPSIPSRVEKYLLPLFDKLQSQIGSLDVEVLCFVDNKKRSIGLKRDSLVQIARGDYVAFVDDDDEISNDYVSSLLTATEAAADVIVFKQITTINNGNPFIVDFGIEYENEDARYDEYGLWQDIKRKPFHVCAWKRELAQSVRFPDASYGEDWHWAKRVLESVKTQHRIDSVLHMYRYNDAVTEAELVFPKEDENVLLPKQ
jgi:glycosyltransferase involved in cell wall biosynthesis